MDHYRLVAGSSGNCRSRQHIDALLDCAYPPIEETSETLFDDIEKRGDKMFFSKNRLKRHFHELENVRHLLSCPCQPCETSRGVGLDAHSIERKIRESPEAWIYLPIMVYLGKLHFVYTWITTGMYDNPHRVLSNMSETHFTPLFRTTLERKLFRRAYDRVLEMFMPIVFRIHPDSFLLRAEYSDITRFPFWHEESNVQQGSFGSMMKFEILEEYLDESMRDRMKDYSGSVTGYGTGRTYVFAKKSLKMSSGGWQSMERDVLQMVSRIARPASDNIITLLAFYSWRQHIHFVFPYISTDLNRLLRNNEGPRSLSLGDEALPQNWLWEQMVGVSRALSAIHTGMKNPFGDVPGRVIAFHFDLKPANILVTADRKLKISDFGQSIIQIVDQDDELETSFMPGDMKYSAPESRPKSAFFGEILAGQPREIMALLNYDVWSLACIMTEVLTQLLAPPGGPNALNRLDQTLNQAPNERRFFDGSGLKQCVKSTLEEFQRAFPASRGQTNYINDVVLLLRDMFQHDKFSRISSEKVVERLQEAHDAYETSSQEVDQIALRVMQHGLVDGQGFRELGWFDGREMASFLRMDGITLELITQQTGETRYRNQNCRFQIFHRSSGVRAVGQPTFAIVWGIEDIRERVDQRKITLSEWTFAPSYLFQESLEHTNFSQLGNANLQHQGDVRFECVLFNKSQRDVAFIFGFQSVQNAQIFQSTLLRQQIFPPSSCISPQVAYSRRGADRVYDRASIQFWALARPTYYQPTRRTESVSTTTGTVNSSSGSSGEGHPLPFSRLAPVNYDAMAVFARGKPPLIVPLNTRDKVFTRQSISVKGVPNRRAGHRFFHVVDEGRLESSLPTTSGQPPAITNIPAVPLGILEDTVNTSRIDTWIEAKSMNIMVSNDEDVDLIKIGVRAEWGNG